jgi:hypothetical protein
MLFMLRFALYRFGIFSAEQGHIPWEYDQLRTYGSANIDYLDNIDRNSNKTHQSIPVIP